MQACSLLTLRIISDVNLAEQEVCGTYENTVGSLGWGEVKEICFAREKMIAPSLFNKTLHGSEFKIILAF